MDRDLQSEAQHLRDHYRRLETAELLALQARGGLTDTAEPILAEELAVREQEEASAQEGHLAPSTPIAASRSGKRFAYILAIVLVPTASYASLVAYALGSAVLMSGYSGAAHSEHMSKVSNLVLAWDAAFVATSLTLTTLNKPGQGIAWGFLAGISAVFVLLLKPA